MDKYRKVIKPKDTTTPKDDEEIRVTAVGSVSAYVSRAATVYGELAKSKVVIRAQGNALTKAVTLAEVIKRRFKGLHQVTNIGQSEIVDEYEPMEEGLDKVTQTRQIPFVEITLSKDSLDTKDKGYQAPIDESLVKELDNEELMKPRGRGGGRSKGRGRGDSKGKGKGRGKGKGKDKSASSKGKGKGKGKTEAPSSKGKGKGKGKDTGKGKGKGKGKSEAPKGKGKGKSEAPKGKSKGKAAAPAKGKGKGSKGESSKGKGKSRSYDYDDYGYGSSKSYSKGSSKGKGKGKGKSSKGYW